jgi:hypothetical protein
MMKKKNKPAVLEPIACVALAGSVALTVTFEKACPVCPSTTFCGAIVEAALRPHTLVA